MLYPHIRHGYREPTHAWDALRSLFALHNQTVNIWTHLLGWSYFMWRSPAILRDLERMNAPLSDFAFVLVYLACAQFQMLSSAAYHLFSYISAEWDRFFLRMDLAGIILMIFGSFAIGLHNGFATDTALKVTYLVIVSTPLLTAAYLTVSPALQSDSMVKTRNTLLAATVAGGVIPAVHWALADDLGCHWDVLWAVGAMFGFYGGGFIVFLLRFPERYMSHVVIDFIGQSHNLWHVCVWLAGASWLEGMVQFYSCQRNGQCHVEFAPPPMPAMNSSFLLPRVEL